MALQFAYSLDGTQGIVKDFPLDTIANYKTGAGTNDAKKGDLIFLNAGLLRRAAIATTKAVGILEAVEFTGLVAQGQPMAAVNASQTASVMSTTLYPNGMGKVRIYNDAVYRIPVKAGAAALTNANVGIPYGLFLDAAGDQTLDVTNVTGTLVKVIDFTKDGKTAFVVLNTNSTI